MTVQINNYNELLEFIKREDTNTKQATEIVCKALTVVSLFEITKLKRFIASVYDNGKNRYSNCNRTVTVQKHNNGIA